MLQKKIQETILVHFTIQNICKHISLCHCMSRSHPQVPQVIIYYYYIIYIIHVTSHDHTDNVNSRTSPCNMTESYPVTIGLQIINGDCSALKVKYIFKCKSVLSTFVDVALEYFHHWQNNGSYLKFKLWNTAYKMITKTRVCFNIKPPSS